MIQITPQMRLLLAVEPVDFRKGIDGLVAVCRQKLTLDPMAGALFVFSNRRRHQTTFNIPTRHRSDRVSVASTARTAVAGSPAKGTERDRGH